MHELTIALSIISAVTQKLAPEQTVTAVTIDIGALTGVVPQALQFVWTSATQDTPLSGSKLHLNYHPVSGPCPTCKKDVTPDDPYIPLCPICDSRLTSLINGRQLDIQSFTIDK